MCGWSRRIYLLSSFSTGVRHVPFIYIYLRLYNIIYIYIYISPKNSTCPLESDHFKRNLVFQPSWFRGDNILVFLRGVVSFTCFFWGVKGDIYTRFQRCWSIISKDSKISTRWFAGGGFFPGAGGWLFGWLGDWGWTSDPKREYIYIFFCLYT